MPHLVILYSSNLDSKVDMKTLCRKLADTMLAQRDAGEPVFPPGGTRVLAYPSAHVAIADDGAAGRRFGHGGDYAFAYFNLRMGRGRSARILKDVGQALMTTIERCFAPLLADEYIGLTLQIDEGVEVFDAKVSTLHPLFSRTT